MKPQNAVNKVVINEPYNTFMVPSSDALAKVRLSFVKVQKHVKTPLNV